MKKIRATRLILEFIQHIAAALILLAVAVLAFNSYVDTEYLESSQTVRIDPYSSKRDFLDSEVYTTIVKNEISDIFKLAAVRAEFETDGLFDSDKRIDIVEFAGREVPEGYPHVVYVADDLIKWGSQGVEYTNRTMSLSDFVNYFGDALDPDNFAIDEDGNLYFAGFLGEDFVPDIMLSEAEMPDDKNEAKEGSVSDNPEDKTNAEEHINIDRERVIREMEKHDTEYLEDMAFSYIMAQRLEGINISREEDGSYSVNYNFINGRFETIDGEKQLISYVDNWKDYVELQKDLSNTIGKLNSDYEFYQQGIRLYSEGNTNLSYVIRTESEGKVYTYDNIHELNGYSNDGITEYFTGLRRYFIYYMDNLEYTGITELSEVDVYDAIRESGYPYLENTKIWMAVDTDFGVSGDNFYNVRENFNRLVPNAVRILLLVIILAFVWLGIFVYIASVTGITYNENEERIYKAYPIDHVFTELILFVFLVLIYFVAKEDNILAGIIDRIRNAGIEALPSGKSVTYEYAVFGIFGLLLSIVFDILAFSIVRRMRMGTLYLSSFVHFAIDIIRRVLSFIVNHKSSALSTLVPYILFLAGNAGLLAALSRAAAEGNRIRIILSIAALVLVYIGVGLFLFKRNAERIDIVKGISKIRDGEVSYKLDAGKLTGTNKELADAVNNIGDGIKRAVDTSMRDEQMKSDLITNVSHDLKTPLTSIINYVDLLKRMKIDNAQAVQYIDVLEQKSARLKQLTEDLLEASKISSGNITLNMEKLDVYELLRQSAGEFSDKFEEKNIGVVMDKPSGETFINADSRRMWRIVDNLFNNICKYAMENTRVFVDIVSDEEKVNITFKNTSKNRLDIRGEELTERFIRGDSSRTTEGSGLGLYIAKSLTEAQGGSFEIGTDGDMFKVFLSFTVFSEV